MQMVESATEGINATQRGGSTLSASARDAQSASPVQCSEQTPPAGPYAPNEVPLAK
jgi:hypothetical protein